MLQDLEEIKEMERVKSHSHGRHFMDQPGGHFDNSFYTEYTGQSFEISLGSRSRLIFIELCMCMIDCKMHDLHDAITPHFLALWLHNKEIINTITSS